MSLDDFAVLYVATCCAVCALLGFGFGFRFWLSVFKGGGL